MPASGNSGALSGVELYTYDTLHRLTNFKRGTLNGNKDGISGTIAREQSWTLQHVGNWADVTSTVNGGTADTPYDERTHNTVNEITTIDPNGAVGSFNVAHDSAGNLNILPDRTDLTKAERYTYDFRNRLLKAEHSANYDQQMPTWTTVADYLCDGLNRRVKKDLPGAGVDVIFVYDGWRCIEERENGQAVRQFVFGGLYLDEILIFDKDTDADGDCTEGEGAGSTRYLYCANDNFNVMALTDSAGAVVEKVKYDPYGQPTVSQVGQAQATGNPFLFQGQRYCPETGLYYFKNRDYSPTLGRFLQRDPLGHIDGMNVYEMVTGQPTSFSDMLGLRKPDIQFIDYLVQHYKLSVEGRKALHLVARRLQEGSEHAVENALRAEAGSIASRGGKFILRSGGLGLGAAFMLLEMRGTAWAPVVPHWWNEWALHEAPPKGDLTRCVQCECRMGIKVERQVWNVEKERGWWPWQVVGTKLSLIADWQMSEEEVRFEGPPPSMGFGCMTAEECFKTCNAIPQALMPKRDYRESGDLLIYRYTAFWYMPDDVLAR